MLTIVSSASRNFRKFTVKNNEKPPVFRKFARTEFRRYRRRQRSFDAAFRLEKICQIRRPKGLGLETLSAIVAVSDDGGSSGRLRDELQMLPPGDIRNCMVALSEDSLLLSKLFRHRFRGDGDLGGHSFGNLFLAALTEITGDFAEAVKISSEILASKGHIYPATVSDVRLAAELYDGSTLKGETKISKVGGKIKRLYLEPENCHPLPEALAAIYEADVITVGPGSLFTSLLPPILVDGMAEAIGESSAVKIFIMQPDDPAGRNRRPFRSKHCKS